MRKRKILISIIAVFLLISGLLMNDSLSSLLRSIQQRFIGQTDTVEVTLVDNLQRTTPIVPGSRIPLTMRVQNLGTDCYIRFKISVYADNEIVRELNEKDIDLAEGWKKEKDGYFYYYETLKENELLDLYYSITTKSDIVIKEEQTLLLETKIQAIQSNHFQDSHDWGDIEIQQTLHSRNEVRLNA